MFKKTISVFLVLIFILTCSFSASALDSDDVEEIAPCYVYATSVFSDISISSKTATCKSVVQGKEGITRIDITQKLQKKNGGSWDTIATWRTTVYDRYATFTNKKSSLESDTYRTLTGARFYKGSATEVVKEYSSTASC